MFQRYWSLSLIVTCVLAVIGCSQPVPATPAPPATGSATAALAGAAASPAAAAPAAPTAPVAAAKRGPSKGELRVAEPFLPQDLDADTGASAFILQGMGIAESLMRYTPDLKVEPWIAARVEQSDPQTWRVTLRDDVTFWDGTKVDAAAVKASLARSLEKQSGLADLIPKAAEISANGMTVTIKTPSPMALTPYNLASANLAIKKVGADGKIVYTGPFMVTDFVARDTLNVAAYDGYRGGPPRLKTIKARQVADTNARALALQAGDVQIAQALVPSDVTRLKNASMQVFAAPWARQHMIIINTKQAPINDANVRRALALAIDRDALVKGVLDGVGAAAYGIAPENIGLPGVIPTQKYDTAEAKRLLDSAGWVPGADGIRVKDGKRLAFNIGTYSGRAELEQFAVVIKDAVKAIGMDLSIEKFNDVETALANNTFSVTTYSIGSAAFGDLSRLLSTLYVPSPRNKDRYNNPKVTELFNQYIITPDAAKRQDQLKQMQEMIGQDAPIVHLVNPYQIVAASPKVKGFAPHPLDQYKYHADVSLNE